MKTELIFFIICLTSGCLSFVTIPDGRIRIQIKPTVQNICTNRDGYIPHETNCSLFYSCENHIPKNGSCPPSMWFDPNHKDEVLCNFPEVVCAANNSVCNCATEYPLAPPDLLIEPSVTCLRDNKFHLNPSSVSCSRYFICHNEQVFRMECRSGFHFNSKTNQCDYPDAVNCKITDADCPADGVRFLRHPERCDSFLFCIHGYKTTQSCPFYQYWDQKSSSCKKQHEVKCDLKIK